MATSGEADAHFNDPAQSSRKLFGPAHRAGVRADPDTEHTGSPARMPTIGVYVSAVNPFGISSGYVQHSAQSTTRL